MTDIKNNSFDTEILNFKKKKFTSDDKWNDVIKISCCSNSIKDAFLNTDLFIEFQKELIFIMKLLNLIVIDMNKITNIEYNSEPSKKIIDNYDIFHNNKEQWILYNKWNYDKNFLMRIFRSDLNDDKKIYKKYSQSVKYFLEYIIELSELIELINNNKINKDLKIKMRKK